MVRPLLCFFLGSLSEAVFLETFPVLLEAGRTEAGFTEEGLLLGAPDEELRPAEEDRVALDDVIFTVFLLSSIC